MEVWQEMIDYELDARREREKRSPTLRAEELKREKGKYCYEREEREHRKRKQGAQL